MHTVLDIDDWARRVAEGEAALLRDDVARILRSGAGLPVALQSVRRRLRRLTPEQRDMVIAAIHPAGRPATY